MRDLVGGGIAHELVLTGRSVSAVEALAIGLVNTVVAPDELDSATAAIVASVARAPRDALLRTEAKIIAAAGIDPHLSTLAL